MKFKAAVFRKVHEPLTIETVEMDRPRGREILVHTIATGVCHSDLHVVDGLGRYPVDRHVAMWREAGFVDVRTRTMSLGGGLVMRGQRPSD